MGNGGAQPIIISPRPQFVAVKILQPNAIVTSRSLLFLHERAVLRVGLPLAPGAKLVGEPGGPYHVAPMPPVRQFLLHAH